MDVSYAADSFDDEVDQQEESTSNQTYSTFYCGCRLYRHHREPPTCLLEHPVRNKVSYRIMYKIHY